METENNTEIQRLTTLMNKARSYSKRNYRDIVAGKKVNTSFKFWDQVAIDYSSQIRLLSPCKS